MEYFKVEKPDLSKIDRAEVLNKYFKFAEKHRDTNIVYELSEPKYFYWDDIRHKPIPKGFSAIEIWFVVRELRRSSSRSTPIISEGGNPFTFLKLDCSDELLHRIDIETGGRIFAPYQVLSDQSKQNFIKRGLIEEAIASSQLEGANTTRKVAKAMILQKREPKNQSERMIINNYKTMQKIEQDWKSREMSLELLFEMHSMLTDKDAEIAVHDRGKLRTDKDNIVVYDHAREKIVHTAPKEAFLKKEIIKLIEYANNNSSGRFIHPIIKAIFLHFWIGYLHPFTDGNGRIARAIFYWYLLKEGYWTMLYLPISTVIRKSPQQYSMAYIYSEQDDSDITYFYDYHLRKIIQALNEFQTYVDKKVAENKSIDGIISKKADVNERQKQTLYYLLSEGEGAFTTAKTYMAVHNVSLLTAYNDLHKLAQLGYVEARRRGKMRNYFLTKKLKNNI